MTYESVSTMRKMTLRIPESQYNLIQQQARKHQSSLADELRILIQNGLLYDVPARNTHIQTTCALEGLLLLRKLADLRDSQLAADAQKEAQALLKKLMWKDE